jgi:FkbM family methyltransferase
VGGLGFSGGSGPDLDVTILPVDVSDFEGTTEIYLHKCRGHNSLRPDIKSEGIIGSRSVPVRILPSILTDHAVPLDFDILTVDTEGLDCRILTNLMESDYRPQIIIYERQEVWCHEEYLTVRTK